MWGSFWTAGSIKMGSRIKNKKRKALGGGLSDKYLVERSKTGSRSRFGRKKKGTVRKFLWETKGVAARSRQGARVSLSE